jgi:hypothetical protein
MVFVRTLKVLTKKFIGVIRSKKIKHWGRNYGDNPGKIFRDAGLFKQDSLSHNSVHNRPGFKSAGHKVFTKRGTSCYDSI